MSRIMGDTESRVRSCSFSLSVEEPGHCRVLLPWKFFPEDFEEVDSQDTLKFLEERSDEEN